MAQSNREKITFQDFGETNKDFSEWQTYVRRAAILASGTDTYLLRAIPYHLKGAANLAYVV